MHELGPILRCPGCHADEAAVLSLSDVVTGAGRWHVEACDLRFALAGFPEACIDAIVTDAPYELGFMGSAWDRSGIAFDPATWAACLRVAKPGAYLLTFGGSRTAHRIACAIEDAGWEIRDTIEWIYGSGFPKSLNVSKAIDKKLGRSAEREVVHQYSASGNAGTSTRDKGGTYAVGAENSDTIDLSVTRGASPEAQAWDGYGTALKPAHEPVIVARKPFRGTVAKNALTHGTGALNIDGCRVATDWNEPDRPESWKRSGHTADADADKIAAPPGDGIECHPGGRWPPNVAFTHSAGCRKRGTKRVESAKGTRGARASTENYRLSTHTGQQIGYGDADGRETVVDFDCVPDCPVRALEEQSGLRRNGGRNDGKRALDGVCYGSQTPGVATSYSGETGTAARYFPQSELDPLLDNPEAWPFLYRSKASRRERENGLSHLPVASNGRRNVHPTVKPVEFMRWLVRLASRPGHLVLDPFLGSGTTGVATLLEGDRRFVGLELYEAHVEIARARMEWAVDVKAQRNKRRSLFDEANPC